MKQNKSKESNSFTYIKEAFHQSWKPISFVGGICFGAYGYINNFVEKPAAWYILLSIIILIILYACYQILSRRKRIAQGRLSVSINDKQNVILLRDDYQKNMDKLLNELSEEQLQRFTFIMGVDRTGDLSVSTKKGVVYSVLDYLDNNYHCNQTKPRDVAQEQLTNYLDKKDKKILSYGECVEIHMIITPINDKSGKAINKPCNILFIANSEHPYPDDENMGECITEGGMSYTIVPEAFRHIEKAQLYNGVMIGAMGTNAANQDYRVILSQTINQFARIYLSNGSKDSLYNLYISIREEDYYDRHQMTLSQIADYVRHCAQFYTKDQKTLDFIKSMKDFSLA